MNIRKLISSENVSKEMVKLLKTSIKSYENKLVLGKTANGMASTFRIKVVGTPIGQVGGGMSFIHKVAISNQFKTRLVR